MKNLLLILLSLLLCVSVFVSCDKGTEESSAIPESREESGQSVAESDDVTSETVPEDSSEEPEPEIPTNVKYQEPVENGGGNNVIVDLPLSAGTGGFSSGTHPITSSDDPEDLYYYVGFYDELDEEDIKFLKSVGVIFTNEEGNVFIKGNEVFPIDEDMTEEELNSAIRKNFEVMFKDVDMSQYTEDELKSLYYSYRLSAVGYINETAHRAVQDADKTYSVNLRSKKIDLDGCIEWLERYRERVAESEKIFKPTD